MIYAVIQTGGKQYRVTPGQVLNVELIEGEVGKTINFDKLLLVGGLKDTTLVGAPFVAKASLLAEIVQQTRGDKILTIKYRRRKGYRRTLGHRQEVTRLLVTKIDAGNGEALAIEEAKRIEALKAASVPFSKRKELRAAAAPKKTAAKAATKKTAAAPKATKTKKA